MTIESTTTTAAQAAANWWAEAIGEPPRFDNGDRSTNGQIISMLATMAAAGQPEPTDGQREGFAALLATAIQAQLDRFPERDWAVTVGVDYGPDLILADAAKAAGVPTSRFPWKTMMWVYSDHVTVSAGYAAPTRLVWASEAWLADRPVCSTQGWDGAKHASAGRDYHGEPWACSLPIYHDEPHRFDTPLALCGKCQRTKGAYLHDREEWGGMPGFHEFEAADQ